MIKLQELRKLKEQRKKLSPFKPMNMDEQMLVQDEDGF